MKSSRLILDFGRLVRRILLGTHGPTLGERVRICRDPGCRLGMSEGAGLARWGSEVPPPKPLRETEADHIEGCGNDRGRRAQPHGVGSD